MFEPLRPVARGLTGTGWPDLDVLNSLPGVGGQRPVNALGMPIRFVEQVRKPHVLADGFEPRAYRKGEVMVRESNWHDLFNALVWLTFPASKAVINARHYSALQAQQGKQRSRQGDALTMFDEDGLVVLSSSPELLDLVYGFRWKELFLDQREAVRSQMRFLVFGHALYEKALSPFVGMTAKSILLTVPEQVIGFEDSLLNAETDRLLAEYIRDPENLLHGRSLSPLPVLGVPGWWPANEDAVFYDDASYFRSGRFSDDACGSSLIS